MSEYPRPEPRIVIAGEEDVSPALAREIVSAIDRLAEAVRELTTIVAISHDIEYTPGDRT